MPKDHLVPLTDDEFDHFESMHELFAFNRLALGLSSDACWADGLSSLFFYFDLILIYFNPSSGAIYMKFSLDSFFGFWSSSNTDWLSGTKSFNSSDFDFTAKEFLSALNLEDSFFET